MRNILISIIIPLYNKELFIERCLDSIFSQYNERIEVIVVNDGSTDNSPNIVKNYTHGKVILIDKENGGVSSARNTGLSYAKGKWVMFMDADDYFLNDIFPSLFDSLQRYSQYSILMANFRTKEFDGSIKNSMNFNKECVIDKPLKLMWLRKISSRPGNTLIRKDAFDTVGKYDESLSYNEDQEFALRLLSIFRPVVIPLSIMEYAKTPNSASTIRHSYDKNFVSKIPFISLESKWIRLIAYNTYVFEKRYNDVANNKTSIGNVFPRFFHFTYLINLVCRKLYSIF